MSINNQISSIQSQYKSQMKSQRKTYLFQNRPIYQWEQSLDSLVCYIALPPLPPNIKPASILSVSITPNTLTVGLKNTPPYLSHNFQGIVDSEQSCWYIQQRQGGGSEVVIQLQKAQKGVRWGAVFKGHANLNPIEEEQLKKKLLLERFQEENPGFDFSGAEFNGQIPQARTFMGGPKNL